MQPSPASRQRAHNAASWRSSPSCRHAMRSVSRQVAATASVASSSSQASGLGSAHTIASNVSVVVAAPARACRHTSSAAANQPPAARTTRASAAASSMACASTMGNPRPTRSVDGPVTPTHAESPHTPGIKAKRQTGAACHAACQSAPKPLRAALTAASKLASHPATNTAGKRRCTKSPTPGSLPKNPAPPGPDIRSASAAETAHRLVEERVLQAASEDHDFRDVPAEVERGEVTQVRLFLQMRRVQRVEESPVALVAEGAEQVAGGVPCRNRDQPRFRPRPLHGHATGGARRVGEGLAVDGNLELADAVTELRLGDADIHFGLVGAVVEIHLLDLVGELHLRKHARWPRDRTGSRLPPQARAAAIDQLGA